MESEKSEVLSRLRALNQPHDWESVQRTFNPRPVDHMNGQPVYEFFDTLTDTLAINPHSLTLSVQPVSSFIPYHLHDYAEIMVPLQGSFTIHLPNTTLTVAQDDLLLIGRQTIHQVEPISADAVVINIALKDNAFTLNDLSFMRQETGRAQTISNMLFALLADEQFSAGNYNLFETNHAPKISALIYDLIHEYYTNDIQSEQIMHSDILALFSRLIRQSYHSAIHLNANNGQQSNDLLALLLYIEANYRNVTLDEMAGHFGFHPNYLSAFLKKHTGYTFIKLVHIQRVNVAAEMLMYTNASIEQIAVRVGYENPSYFYKIFKKMIGSSPTDYRQQNRH